MTTQKEEDEEATNKLFPLFKRKGQINNSIEMSSQEEKEAGAVAWGQGDFDTAIEKFSNAINAEKSGNNDKTFLKTVYSNRSAAYMKTNNKNAALLDADECLKIDSNWSKGFIRKGDALFSMAKYTEAYNAYNSAHRLDSTNEGVKSKCNLAEKAIRDSANAPSPSSTSSTTASSSPTYLKSAHAYLRLFVIVNAVAYFITAFLAPAIGRFCYRNFVVASIVDYLVAVYNVHGLPKMSMEYAQRLMLDPSSMYLFLSLLLLMQRPSMLAMAPILITAIVHSTHYIYSVVERKDPDMLTKVGALVGKYIPPVLQQTPEAWERLTTSAKWRVFDQELVRMACYCEVLQGFAFVVQLVFPSRNFLGTMMWWQYLQMRYMMDQQGPIKAAFASVDSNVTRLLSHRFCPRALATGYGYVKTFCANKVKIPEAGQEAPSMSSMIPKCTIS